MIWYEGTYHPHVSSEGNWTSDAWHVTGTFEITNLVNLTALAPMAIDGKNNPVMSPSGMHWKLILADGGFVNPNVRPSFNGAIWAIDPVGNPVKEWDLRSI